MTQDLIDWLSSTHKEEEHDDAEGISLLVVPVLPAPQETPELTPATESTPQPDELPQPAKAPSDDELARKITALNDAWQTVQEHEPEESPDDPQNYYYADTYPEDSHTDSQPEESPDAWRQALDDSIDLDDSQIDLQAEDSPDAEEEQQSPEEDTEDFDPEEHSSILNDAWHNAADLHINLNEPPQEMWTDLESDDEQQDYEVTQSLQGAAYIPVKHGANFTQRLHATLQSRKERAAQQREYEEQNANHHPYLQKALILCGVMLMALGFAYLGLWFIERETPDGINQRARNLYEQGEFDEAVIMYQRGYQRYPHVLTFLTGIARSAEKAGHTQTAITAWNEYAAALPKDDEEHRRAAREELARLIPGGQHESTAKAVQPALPPTHKTRPNGNARATLPEVRSMTFDEILAEGNNAFNIGMFSRAIANFHKAHAIRENDIRPYIGLAGAYRAKGMYFDAKRFLDEARRKFGRDPALEVEMYFLRRE